MSVYTFFFSMNIVALDDLFGEFDLDLVDIGQRLQSEELIG